MRIVAKVVISALFIGCQANNSPEGGYWIEEFYINEVSRKDLLIYNNLSFRSNGDAFLPVLRDCNSPTVENWVNLENNQFHIISSCEILNGVFRYEFNKENNERTLILYKDSLRIIAKDDGLGIRWP